jgi:phosphate:Na+ symporter
MTGRVGRVLIGLGLITLALQLIVAATEPLTEPRRCARCWWRCPTRCCWTSWSAPCWRCCRIPAWPSCCSPATLAAQGMLPSRWRWAWCWAPTWAAACWRCWSPARARPNCGACRWATSSSRRWARCWRCRCWARRMCCCRPTCRRGAPAGGAVPPGLQRAAGHHCSSASPARWRGSSSAGCPRRRRANGDRPRHLDPVALATPSLAISCAAREALHQADVVETMLRGVLPVMRDNDLELAERLRRWTTPSTSSTRPSSST